MKQKLLLVLTLLCFSFSSSLIAQCEQADWVYLNTQDVGQVEVSWWSNNPGKNYTIEYGIAGFSKGSGEFVPGMNDDNGYTEITILGLESSTEYDFYLVENCDLNNQTIAISNSITTLGDCESTNYLSISNEGIGEVRLYWNTYHKEQSFTIEYGLAGFTPGEGIEVTGTNNNNGYTNVTSIPFPGVKPAKPYSMVKLCPLW